MTEHQRQEPLSQTPLQDFEAIRVPTGTCAALKQNNSDQKREDAYEDHLNDLQQFIRELLIKNQRLRWLLETATNRSYQEVADEHYGKTGGN